MVQIQDFLDDPETLKERIHPLQCIDCSVMPYREALDLQLELNGLVASKRFPSVMLLVEHPPVITLGIHRNHNQLIQSEDQLAAMGIEVVQIRRGGGTTAHNPGQLVIYPIVNLDEFGFHVAPFVHYLEHIAMEVLAKTNIHATRRNRYPGLWFGERKIASIGIQIARRTSMHGIAINLYNDLGIFDCIVPCGIDGVEMTSVEKEGGLILPMQQLKDVVQSSCLSLLTGYGGRKEADR